MDKTPNTEKIRHKTKMYTEICSMLERREIFYEELRNTYTIHDMSHRVNRPHGLLNFNLSDKSHRLKYVVLKQLTHVQYTGGALDTAIK